jgi:hypothetical protein
VVLQDMAKRDSKWKNLAAVSIQHAMSVDAPTFKPNTASASLSPVRMPMLGPNENQEILKQNIAHMYKYYNDLIYRQNDGTTKFDKPTLPEINSFRPRSVSPLPKENVPSNQPVQTLQLQKESMPAKVGQNTAIQLRYTTKQLVQIFKGLGRF